MDDTTKSILMNKDVIAVDQDRLGIQGDRVSAVGPFEVWSKPLEGGAKAVALFNRSEAEYPDHRGLQVGGLRWSCSRARPVVAQRSGNAAMVRIRQRFQSMAW